MAAGRARRGREVDPRVERVEEVWGEPGAARLEHHRPGADRAGRAALSDWSPATTVTRPCRRWCARGWGPDGGVVLTLPARTGLRIVHAVAATCTGRCWNVPTASSSGTGPRGGLHACGRGDWARCVGHLRLPVRRLHAGGGRVRHGVGLHDTAVQLWVLIMVSKARHCLTTSCTGVRPNAANRCTAGDRQRSRPGAARGGARCRVRARTGRAPDRAAGRAACRGALPPVSELGIDFIVPARTLRIPSPELCAKTAGRIINITTRPPSLQARALPAGPRDGVKPSARPPTT